MRMRAIAQLAALFTGLSGGSVSKSKRNNAEYTGTDKSNFKGSDEVSVVGMPTTAFNMFKPADKKMQVFNIHGLQIEATDRKTAQKIYLHLTGQKKH